MTSQNIFTDYIDNYVFINSVLERILHDLKETFPNLTPDQYHGKMLEYVDENFNESAVYDFIVDEFGER